jgi:hypothetical protein
MLCNERFSQVEHQGERRYISDPNGPIYAPASATEGTIAELDFQFQEDAAFSGLCSGCGNILSNSLRIFTSYQPDGEAPLHPQCAAYALRVCPHLTKKQTIFVASTTKLFKQAVASAEYLAMTVPGEDALEIPKFLFFALLEKLSVTSGLEAMTIIREATAASRLPT